MQFMYCTENELNNLIKSIRLKAYTKNQNINIIPQFVGWNPISVSCGNSNEPYLSIILMPSLTHTIQYHS